MPASQSDLLKGLTADEAARLLAMGTAVMVPRGGVLFDLGAHADRLYSVVAGRVTLTLPMLIRGKQEDVLIEERLAGETVGWSGLVPPHKFTLKAIAAVDSEVTAFSRAALLDHFAAYPNVAAAVTRNVAAVIGHRLQVFQTMWVREMQRTVENRYA